MHLCIPPMLADCREESLNPTWTWDSEAFPSNATTNTSLSSPHVY